MSGNSSSVSSSFEDVTSANEDIQSETDAAAFGTRLEARAAELHISRSNLMRWTGIPSSTLGQYFKGQRLPASKALLDLAEHLDVSPRWLLTGEERPAKAELANQTHAPNTEMVEVSEIDLAYGLGSTYSDGPIEVVSHWFPRAWIEAITNTPPSMLTFARGRGDSMQPTIQDGDLVLIDRSQRTVREQDAIWALTVGEWAMVKRLRGRGERVTMLSDNDRIPPDEAHYEEINIVGRVIFIGRRI